MKRAAFSKSSSLLAVNLHLIWFSETEAANRWLSGASDRQRESWQSAAE